VIVRTPGRLRLDIKFVEGMRLHARLWGGAVHVIVWQDASSIPFGAEYDVHDLGFTIKVLQPGQEIGPDHIRNASMVAASGDLIEALDLPRLCRDQGAGLVYSLEYTLRTRLDIVALDRSRSALRKAWSMIWHLRKERRLRVALRACDSVQFNGFPTQQAYGHMTKDGLLYLDGRMSSAMMARDDQMQARAARLASGAPLRIVHSGRLATMKGSQDLVPIARALKQRGAHFRLDIFGTGELESEIAAGINAHGLADCVQMHAPIDFETELVPYMQTSADIFLSCHRQGDPSCTYLESFGCGLPVIGYDNEMWRAMQADSHAGWVVPMGKTDKMAARLEQIILNPAEVAIEATKALAYAKAHDFESQFLARMRHFARHVGSGRPPTQPPSPATGV
jgi:glycosyltransferase involved in cell wall biosynthesis